MTARPLFAAPILALAAVLLAHAPGLAVPEPLTKTEIGCQAAFNKALPAYGKARTACVASCQKKTPLSADCTAPFGGKTLECVQKADAKLASVFAKKCPSAGTDEDTCPECYEGLGGTCAGFATRVTDKTVDLTDEIANVSFCDDSGSPDGLTKAEAKCQKATALGYAAFAAAASKCEAACLKSERKGKTDATCNPQALLFLGGDSKTSTCVFKAFGKLGVVGTKCVDRPECLNDGPLFSLVTDSLAEIGGDVAVCPAECGDGYANGDEACDPPNSFSCAGGAQCSPTCTCPS